MKNILNSFNSGLFRTLGKLVAYFLLGYILLSFLNSNDIKFPQIFNVLNVYADTYELELYNSNYTFQVENIGYGSSNFSYTTFYDAPVIHSTYWENNSAIPVSSNVDYFKWNIRFKNTPPLNSYNITGFIDLNWATKFVTSIYWVNGNTVCNIINSDSDTPKRLNFKCENVGITEQYVSIVINVDIPSTSGGTISPNISRYLNLELTQSALQNEQIENDNQNTQDIIDNQNQNSENEINSQKVCDFIDKNDIETDNKYLNSNGTTSDSNSYGITNYVTIDSRTEIIPKSVGYAYSCFYNVNKERISCISNTNGLTVGTKITIPNNARYFRSSIFKSSNIPTFEICKTGNQAMQDALTDDNIDKSIFDFSNLPVASDTPISDLLLLPMNLINTMLSAVNNTCVTYEMPFFNDTTLNFPCIDIENYLGSDLWGIIDKCIVFYMAYNIFMLFIMVFDDITSLDDEFHSLYTPRHSGLTRVGRGNLEGRY